ncbi:MAG TPA: two-component sensor histidine kinase [Lachnospiraceae bacterium]|nr:HAMP domain-containing protein [Lachnospiraceae bacterium]MCR4785925.1 cell wall metabolism sensor histidine kinase WalK [Lachnospiraceae bacterium]HAL32583.1 two-component sensor histidine kinase [Lachnospiraceae bacterium]HBB59858.1 two-component sensor histidine kinase [Lachnospiraceae bacterium]HCS00335.1 two-component sensor histidine kinase [Lachnospiraceae bacterium]
MKLHRTLYIKLILAYLVFFLLSFIIISSVNSRMILNDLTRTRAESLYRESRLVATTYGNDIYKGMEARQNALGQLKAIDTYISADIRVIDVDGRQILDSRSSEDVVFSDFDPAAIGSYYLVSDFYGTYDEEYLSVFYPITSRYSVRGYVVIQMPMSDLYASRDRLLDISYITMLFMYLFSLSVMVVFTFAVYRPVRHITKAAEEYAKGNYDYDPDVHGRDEIGYLAGTLHYMASEIGRSEDNQKKFIANVSHDFRSPLTSINGYLNAMIDGTIPPEMHEKYLHVVLNETDRLTKLTNGLLELNSLSSKGMVLTISDFDINAAIRQICETFDVLCSEKKISIELILSGEKLFVSADMGKIQQVIANLTDNAIKFSHRNSIIKIETTEKGDIVFVSVKDSGIGIPADSQKLVFDRFYKTDLSRGKDKKGTGLGLAIAKEILLAHGQNINVISTEGVGSEFIFTLARSRNTEAE